MADPAKRGEKFNDVQYRSLENTAEAIKTNLPQSDKICGCGPCQPDLLQRLTNPIVFTAHAGSLLAIYLCALTYFSGILTTIERQFQLSSDEVAALTVLNDASNLCVILFVTYFGHQSHRPRWVATGSILIAVGLICCSLPHYLSDPIDPQSLIAGQGNTHTQASQSQGVCDTTLKSAGNQSRDLIFRASNDSSSDECRQEISSKGMGLVKWLVIGQIIIGIGGAPAFPLVLSYIDDAVKNHKLTSYTAFLFIAVLIGPIGGFFLTSTATSFYVDFDRVPADEIPDLEHNDPRWIGAWWLCFPLFSILLIIAAIPMFLYPKLMILKPTETCAEENQEEDEKAEDTASLLMTSRSIFMDTSNGILEGLKGIVFAIKRLLFNAPLMLLYLGGAAETAIGAINSTFQVKYFQTQFGASPAKAALLMGGVIVPCVIMAQVVSAIICRRYKLDKKQCAAFILGCHVVGLVSVVTQLFIGCGNIPTAGINVPYSLSDAFATSQPDGVSIFQSYEPIEKLELDSECNSECACSDEIFQPVCGANGVSYISPCHAGCTQLNSSDPMIYIECACISARAVGVGDIPYDTAVPGLCQESCDSTKQLTILMAVAVVVTFVMSLTFNPHVFLTFRLVETDDRSIAMGFNSVIQKCLGYFPAPILMGMVINSTCTLWQYTCGNRGSCWMYDVLTYRYLFIGICGGLKCFTVFCYSAVYLVIKSSKEEDNNDDQTKTPNSNIKSTAV